MKTGDTTMPMRRIVCASLLSLLAAGACAQAPTLRILVPFPAGGVTDLAARALAERLGPALGQTVIVENRPGGGSRIGTDAAIKAAPDGQTLLFTNTSYAILPIVDPTVKIEADKSMLPVGMLATYGLAFAISNSLPARSLSEFVAHARSRPGKLSYGSSGPGSGTHFLGEYFKSLTGTFIVHIPYRSTAGALNDVAGGTLDMTFDATAKAYADAGKVRVLAVTGAHRDPRMPNVPTAAEAGLKDFVIVSWVGLLAPVGTPEASLARLNAALNEALSAPVLRQRLQEMGLTPEGGERQRMLRQIREDVRLHRQIAERAQLRFE
jgi:tripartite-type tricarboxylate transporter receptor subunit TctC